MSVPQGWTQAAPEIRKLAAALPTNLAGAPEASLANQGGIFGQMAVSSLAGRAVAASATHSVMQRWRGHWAVSSPRPIPPQPPSS